MPDRPNAPARPPAADPPRTGRVLAAAAKLADHLAARAGGLAGAEVRLDLGSVEAVASGELGALILLSRRAREAGGRLALVGVRPPVAELFQATRLDTILDVRPAFAERAGPCRPPSRRARGDAGVSSIPAPAPP